MGLWSYLQVIQYYSNLGQLGILSAAERELPYYFGKKNQAKSEEITGNALSFTLLISLVLFVGIAIYAFSVKSAVSVPYFYGLLTVAVLAFGGQIGLLYTVLLRAHKNFSILSQAKVIFALAWLILTLTLVIPFNIYGIYLVAIVVMYTNIAFCYCKTRYPLKFDLNLVEIKRLFVIGAPLILFSAGLISIKSIDRVFIVNMLGPEQLGYYSIAIMASDYVFSIPATFSIVMFPRFQESYALKDSIVDIQNFIHTPTLILSHFMAIIIGFALIILPPTIRLILPQYLEGIPAMKILLLGAFFISLTHMSSQFLITLNKQGYMVPLVFFVAAVSAILNYVAIKGGYGIQGVAFGTGLANFLYYLLILGYAMLHYTDIKNILKFMAGNLFPWLVIIGFIEIITQSIPLSSSSWFSLLLNTLLRAILFGIFCIPLLWHIDKKTGVIKRIFRIVGEMIPSRRSIGENHPCPK